MRSHYGYAQTCCWAAIRWRAISGQQVHDSSRGPELIAGVAGTHVAMMQRQLTYEARFGTAPGDITMSLHMDNTASLANTTADNIHLGSRNLSIRIGVIRQVVRDSIIRPTYVSTHLNIADSMTKPMDRKHILAFAQALYGVLK